MRIEDKLKELGIELQTQPIHQVMRTGILTVQLNFIQKM